MKNYDRLRERDFADEIQSDLQEFDGNDYIYCKDCDEYHLIDNLPEKEDNLCCPVTGSPLIDENGNEIKTV